MSQNTRTKTSGRINNNINDDVNYIMHITLRKWTNKYKQSLITKLTNESFFYIHIYWNGIWWYANGMDALVWYFFPSLITSDFILFKRISKIWFRKFFKQINKQTNQLLNNTETSAKLILQKAMAFAVLLLLLLLLMLLYVRIQIDEQQTGCFFPEDKWRTYTN